MRSESTAFRTLEVAGGAVVPFLSIPGERVRIVYGQVWLTEEGKARDAFLAGGAEVDLDTRGLAVIEALEAARIELIAPGSPLQAETDNGWGKAMTRGLETTAFFAATVSALVLTAIIGLQEFGNPAAAVSGAFKALAQVDGRPGLVQRVEVQPRRPGG